METLSGVIKIHPSSNIYIYNNNDKRQILGNKIEKSASSYSLDKSRRWSIIVRQCSLI